MSVGEHGIMVLVDGFFVDLEVGLLEDDCNLAVLDRVCRVTLGSVMSPNSINPSIASLPLVAPLDSLSLLLLQLLDNVYTLRGSWFTGIGQGGVMAVTCLDFIDRGSMIASTSESLVKSIQSPTPELVCILGEARVMES